MKKEALPFSLTEKDVRDYSREAIERRAILAKIREKGRSAYIAIRDYKDLGSKQSLYDKPAISIGDFKIGLQLIQNPHLIPDELNDYMSSIPKLKRNEPKTQDIRAWLIGFGMWAIDSKDLITGINALDIATDGKYFEDQDLMKKLRTLSYTFQDPKEVQVEMAKHIDARRRLRDKLKREAKKPKARVPKVGKKDKEIPTKLRVARRPKLRLVPTDIIKSPKSRTA